jgi:hypothetical protein
VRRRIVLSRRTASTDLWCTSVSSHEPEGAARGVESLRGAPDREEGLLYDVLGDAVVSAQIRRAKE